MGVLVVGSWLITRNLSTEPEMSRWQSALETIVSYIRDQIYDIAQQDPSPYLPFIGTLFLFISLSNMLGAVPIIEPPTSSLSTTAALALCVFFAVPVYGISQEGLTAYLRHYIEPTPLMAPFQIISELSRTLALALRLFGNVMSGTLIVAILLSIVPLFLPVVLNALELLIGQIQAYIFAVLAMVYIASGIEANEEQAQENK
jgi:F-type H+-transporting ATPase subunit a